MIRAAVIAIVIAATASRADAYEFWLRSQTIGQAYQLREYKLVGPDVLLGRRRYTETLALRIWDIGDFARERRRARLPERGIRVSWQSYLRIDHDFGSYANGRIQVVDTRRDALDVIPELDESLIVLDLMFGYLEVAGIAGDRVTLRVGRLPVDEGWGATAVDGGSVRVELPQPVAVTASVGLRVRASSPMGLSTYELDGTGGAACREYVEAADPGTGAWKLVDRNRAISGGRFSSDLEFCPQREQRQPTLAVGIQTSRMRNFGAEIGYRRTSSATVGLIGPVDRLDFPDQGLYPNEFGQAPGRGVNQEHVHARVHAELVRRDITIGPFANARVSLLHAALDRFDAGIRLTRDGHTIEPVLGYFLPTFDGDSIFNVFSIEPTTDARLNYRRDGLVQVNAAAWLRRYAHFDNTSSVAGGLEAGLERRLSKQVRGRADALWDDGYGGRRLGGSTTAFWHARQHVWLRGRVIVLGVAPDDDRTKYVTSSTVLGATYKLGDNAALHAIGEVDYDAIHATQLRAIAILDLAFIPEP